MNVKKAIVLTLCFGTAGTLNDIFFNPSPKALFLSTAFLSVCGAAVAWGLYTASRWWENSDLKAQFNYLSPEIADYKRDVALAKLLRDRNENPRPPI